MSKPEGFLIDLDGTLYRGEDPVPGARQFMEWLRGQNRPYLFLTNCPSRTPEQVAEKLIGLGIQAVPRQVLTSGMIAARFLHQREMARVFLVGEAAVRRALEDQGLQVTDRNPDCVLVAWDRQFCYDTLNKALWLLEGGRPFFCTNPDETIPDGSRNVAHTGAICAAIERAARRQAVYLGKPNHTAGRIAAGMLGLPATRLCVIGDRLDMDVRFARNCRMQSVLTLTGAAAEGPIPADCRPDRVVKTLDELIDLI